MASSSGARSARLTTSQYRPCRVANATSPVSSAADTWVTPALPAGPARQQPIALGGLGADQRAFEQLADYPKPNPRSSSPPRAVSTVIFAASARRRNASSSTVFPIPAGPSISRTPPVPATASLSAESMRSEVVLAIEQQRLLA